MMDKNATRQADKVSHCLRHLSRNGYIKKDKCDLMLWEVASGKTSKAKIFLSRLLNKYPSAREEILWALK